MKTLIVVYSLLVSASKGQNCSKNNELANTGRANFDIKVPCRDLCSGKLIEDEDCKNTRHCTNNGAACILLESSKQANITDPVLLHLNYLNNLPSNKNASRPRVGARVFRPNLSSRPIPPPGVTTTQNMPLSSSPFSLCPQFPQACSQCYASQFSLEAPVDVPYCQRVPCFSESRLDSNAHRCFSQPGCFFDFELQQYRSVLGQAVLPGVPICHLAIRNVAFHKRANAYIQQYNSWNPLVTECLLNENRENIYGTSAGCSMIEILEYFGHHAKRAGWPGITPKECLLINGCWKTTPSSDGYCAYPIQIDQLLIRSSNEERQLSPNGQESFGLPSCMPFDPKATGADFLSAYHICLASGCAARVDTNTLWRHLYMTGSVLTSFDKLKYLQMIYSGDVRADNFQALIDILLNKRNNLEPGSHRPIGNVETYSLNLLLAMSLNGNTLSSTTNVPFSVNSESAFPYFKQYASNELQQPPNQDEYLQSPNGFSSPEFLSVLSQINHSFPVPTSPCQYQQKQLQYHGLPKLKGSFAGCCDRPLCYIPKSQLSSQYSGVSSYLTHWSHWGQCSASCDGGKQNRTRVCIGKTCNPNALKLQIRTCNTLDCPYYSSWSDFNECSVTCDGGIQTRTRICHGAGNCQGLNSESQACATGRCPTFVHGQWSACDTQCGSGFRQRKRECADGGNYGCPDEVVFDEEKCEALNGKYVQSCNRRTCLFEQICIYNGAPAACCENNYFYPNQRCYEGQCRCRYNPFACITSFT